MRRLVNPIQPIRVFRDEPMTTVYRHWRCATDECDGEMKSTGRGMTTMDTSWQHRCDKCSREEWSDHNYPRVAYLPIEALDTSEVTSTDRGTP